MVKWCEPLYLDDEIGKNPQKWKKKVEDNKPVLELYCICIASNPKNLFDIINCNEMLFHYYKRQELFVVGMAKGRFDAELLVEKIISDIYNETKDFKVREYFRLDGYR